MDPRRVLCIWFPNWPCQRLVAEHREAGEPLPAAVPCVLRMHDPRRGWLVAAANWQARQLGIRPGLAVAEAVGLLEAAGGEHGQLREHQPEHDLQRLVELAEQAQRFSPQVGLEPVDAQLWVGRSLLQPQGLVLDATGMGQLFGSESVWLEQIQQWLASLGLIGCLALADSLAGAWAAANYGLRPEAAECLRQQGGPPVWPAVRRLGVVIPAGRQAEQLGRLPVSALRITADQNLKLQRLGLKTIEQLAQLPRTGLASRLGPELLARLDRLWQAVAEPLTPVRLDAELCGEVVLEQPTDRHEVIAQRLSQLVQQLTDQLRRLDRGALRLVARLQRVGGPAEVLSLSLFRPVAEPQYLQQLLQGRLEPRLSHLGWVERVRLEATLTGPLRWHQPSLLDQTPLRYADQAAALIDRLSCRLGPEAVLQPQLLGEPLPELSCRWQRLSGGPGGRGVSGELSRRRPAAKRPSALRLDQQLEVPLGSVHQRPLWLLPEPQPLEVLAGYPEAPPARLCWQGRWLGVLDSWGPERIESGWWQGGSRRRDYYRLALEDGRWAWVFRQLAASASPPWFLHGWFD
jgi:protein ImuB